MSDYLKTELAYFVKNKSWCSPNEKKIFYTLVDIKKNIPIYILSIVVDYSGDWKSNFFRSLGDRWYTNIVLRESLIFFQLSPSERFDNGRLIKERKFSYKFVKRTSFIKTFIDASDEQGVFNAFQVASIGWDRESRFVEFFIGAIWSDGTVTYPYLKTENNIYLPLSGRQRKRFLLKKYFFLFLFYLNSTADNLLFWDCLLFFLFAIFFSMRFYFVAFIFVGGFFNEHIERKIFACCLLCISVCVQMVGEHYNPPLN